MVMSRTCTALALASVCLGTVMPASASVFAEIGDAGRTVATAQSVPAGTTAITGTIASSFLDGLSDVDLYAFGWGGGPFWATTFLNPGTLVDSQLFLFDAAGFGIAGNDDIAFPLITHALVGADLPAGNYLLGVSAYNADPDNFDFFDVPVGGALVDWTEWGWDTGTYQVDLFQATSAPVGPVPEPSTIGLMLLGIGMVGWMAHRRRPGSTSA